MTKVRWNASRVTGREAEEPTQPRVMEKYISDRIATPEVTFEVAGDPVRRTCISVDGERWFTSTQTARHEDRDTMAGKMAVVVGERVSIECHLCGESICNDGLIQESKSYLTFFRHGDVIHRVPKGGSILFSVEGGSAT